MKTITQKLFYGKFTDWVIANVLIVWCWILGIRKGRRLISFHSGYSNSGNQSLVEWVEITGFFWVWVDIGHFDFSIEVYGLRPDDSTAYRNGWYSIKEMRNALKAQGVLKENFKGLYYPPVKA